MHPVRSFVLYELCASMGIGMMATVGSLFQLSIGLSIADIALVNIAFWTTIILAELPTGMLADGKSRIWSVRVGICVFGLGFFAYALAQGFWTAMLAEITIGVGMAFISGAEEAWVTDALKKRGEERLLGRAFGSQALAAAIGATIGGCIGAALGLASFRLSWAAGGLMLCAAAWVAFRLMDESGEIDDRASELEAFRLSCKALRKGHGLLWSVAATVVFGLVVCFNHLWQPFFKEEVGQPELTWVWLVIQSTFIAASWSVRRWGVPDGKAAASILLALLLSGAGLVVTSGGSGFLVLISGLMVHELGRGLFRPVMSVYTQRRIESRYRATFGSLQSLLGKSGMALSLVLMWGLAAGRGADRETITLVWSTAGFLLLAGTVLLWLFRPRRR